MVLFTVAALIFREPLLEKRLVIDANSQELRFVLDSDVQDGGSTQVEWLDRENLVWHCILGDAYEYPFCGMQIYFSDSYMHGVDLTNFTHLNISVDYEGEAATFRLFFRNSNPHYTAANEIRSTKFNMAELDVRKGPEHNNIQLSHFRVADWWLLLYDLEMAYSQIEFSNVGLIEIQTGSGVGPGEHTFELNKLELVGVRISLEQMYFGIIVVWMVTILLLLALRIRFLQMEVKAGAIKHAELQEIHTLLDQRNKTLQEKIKLDPLTGAYNRAGIEESLLEAFHEWKVHARPLSLLLFDVDHFKQVNDSYGHAVGDAILRELTQLVSENIRDGDKFARWGGEEFIIVCGNTELEKACALAEKLREKISNNKFYKDLHVSASFGVAQIKRDESLGKLFNRTDKGLYLAKDAGRNSVRSI